MSSNNDPFMRPKLKVSEATMLFKILSKVPVDADSLEEAIFRERLQNSIKRFLAVHSSYSIDKLNKIEPTQEDFDVVLAQLDAQFSDPKYFAKPEDLAWAEAQSALHKPKE